MSEIGVKTILARTKQQRLGTLKPAALSDSVQTTKAQGSMLQPKSMTLGMISLTNRMEKLTIVYRLEL